MTIISKTSRLNRGPFVATFKTDNAGVTSSNQVRIPAIAGIDYNCWIDWGDGSKSTLITSQSDVQWTKTYSSAGTYIIKIYGSFMISYNNAGDVLKILSVNRWGSINLSNCPGLFYGCSNLVINATDIPYLNYSSVTFLNFFFNCTSIIDIPNIDQWNLSKVTSLQAMFRGCASFNSPLNSWRPSSCTNFNFAFYGCAAFNQPLNNWNVSSATSMTNMFQNCTSFNGELNGWNTSNVTTIAGIFQGCTSFNKDLNSWDVSKVTTMNNAFSGCTAFNGNISSWNPSLCTGFSGTFQNCSSFNVNLSSWNVSNSQNLNFMFSNAIAFDQNLGSWNVTNVNSMVSMFSGVTLSTSNYNCILAGWASQAVKNNITFDGGNSKYDAVTGTCNGTAGRNTLTTTYNWTITDGGPA